MAVKFPVGVIEEGSLSLTRNLWNAWDFVFVLFSAIIVARFLLVLLLFVVVVL